MELVIGRRGKQAMMPTYPRPMCGEKQGMNGEITSPGRSLRDAIELPTLPVA